MIGRTMKGVAGGGCHPLGTRTVVFPDTLVSRLLLLLFNTGEPPEGQGVAPPPATPSDHPRLLSVLCTRGADRG